VVAFVGNGGVICWLFVIVCCGPYDVRRSWSYRVGRDVTVSSTMIVGDLVMLGAPDGCSNMTDGSEIPKVFRVAVVLAMGTYISGVRWNWGATDSS